MKNTYALIFAFLLTLLLFSCEKEEFNEDFLWYRKAETGCLDPWDSYSGQSDSELAGAVKEYLNERLIEYDKVIIGFDSILVQGCLSCACTTGRYIEVHSPIIHEEVLNEIGFFVIPNE